MVNGESDKGIYKQTLFFCCIINLPLLQKKMKIGGQRSDQNVGPTIISIGFFQVSTILLPFLCRLTFPRIKILCCFYGFNIFFFPKYPQIFIPGASRYSCTIGRQGETSLMKVCCIHKGSKLRLLA